ncbi:MAG: helix-turn-helix domain-containing protein [Rhodoblastus sp.]
MRSADIDQVRPLPLFRGMAPARFDELVAGAMLQRFPAHVELIREGDRPDFLYILFDGLIELYSERDDDELGFLLLRPFSAFIMAAVVRDMLYLNSARTLSPARVLMIPADAVRAAIEAEPVFGRAIMHALAVDYRRVLKELKDRKFRPTIERLANWLLREMEPKGDGGALRLPFDKRKLAAHIGTTPENLSRTFAALGAHGVGAQGREIVIANTAQLTLIARPDPLIDDPQT